MIWLIERVHALPDFAIFFLVTVCIASPGIAASFLGSRLLRLGPNDRRSDGALDAFKAVASAAILVLGFSLVQVQANLRNAETQVSREAATLNAVDRILLRSGAPDLIALRPALRAYGKAIIAREWPLLSYGERSTEVDSQFSAVSRGVRSFEPATPRQQAMLPDLLRSVDELADLREARIAASRIFLPGLFYWTISCLVLLLVALAALTVPTEQRVLQIGGAMVAIGLLLSFVIVIDGPYEGDTSVSPDSIVTTLSVMAARR